MTVLHRKIDPFGKNVFTETTSQAGSHPAVLGFVIQDKHNSSVVTYLNNEGTNKDAVKFLVVTGGEICKTKCTKQTCWYGSPR